ncbi:hypothetical protein ABC766_10305 [Methylobacterium fujisawaense]|uniref:hypothetical protein n=1 Tax=Methylobacterium fujisawaense TaxID=107400 RepID=UPI0031F4AF1A
MKNKLIPIFVGIAMVSGLPGYASAGWMDNVPLRFLPQAHQTASRNLETRDAGLTTGSISATPQRPVTHRPARARANF